jgi:hypothetical protein
MAAGADFGSFRFLHNADPILAIEENRQFHSLISVFGKVRIWRRTS